MLQYGENSKETLVMKFTGYNYDFLLTYFVNNPMFVSHSAQPSSLRKVLRNHRCFPSDESVMKVIYRLFTTYPRNGQWGLGMGKEP